MCARQGNCWWTNDKPLRDGRGMILDGGVLLSYLHFGLSIKESRDHNVLQQHRFIVDEVLL